jgi:uncharacterized phage protein (TIGR02218 family)
MPYDFAVGNTVLVYAGCDRRFATCKSRFDNRVNFRGFPNIPGMDKAMTIPANRKWTTE